MSALTRTTRWALPLGCFAAGITGASLWRQQPLEPINPKVAETQHTARHGPVTLMDAVGNTPLIELKRLSELTGCNIYAKAEYMNPGGSIKDRAAKFLILEAEEKRLVKPGDTIVEPTGGNTGVSLALLAGARGYKTIFTMSEKTATEKIELMKALGAEVIVQPLVSMLDKENHFYHVAHRVAREREGAYCPDQFENTANTKAHYMTTGPEIWEQTNGEVDGFVCAAGSAGTIAGITKYLKEKNPSVHTWIVDGEEIEALAKFVNEGRTTSYEKDGFELVPSCRGITVAEGVGIPRITPNFREACVDRGVTGSNEEIVNMAYFLLREEGVFAGPSAALNVVGAVKMAQELGPGHTIVTVLCDSGERYLSKLYNMSWLGEQKLTPKLQTKSSLDFISHKKK